MAPRARFELATLRLTAEGMQNLNALVGVAYITPGAILTFLTAPNPAGSPLIESAHDLHELAPQQDE